MTTITVPEVARPVADDMFADITDLPPAFDGLTVTFDDAASPLTDLQVAQVRIRLATTGDDQETLFRQAYTALANNQAFLDVETPTTAQAVAQVKALTRQVDALVKVALRLV